MEITLAVMGMKVSPVSFRTLAKQLDTAKGSSPHSMISIYS